MKGKTLGATIAELRKQQGMTQLDLAKKMNVTDKAVSKWERDLSCPDVASLPRLAETLGVTVDELMSCASKPSSSERQSVRDTVELVLKCVGLAMGVAVVALGALGELGVSDPLAPSAGMTMLGVGLVCLGIGALGKKE